MFDCAEPPAFLIKHAILDNAANGQLRVFLDRIVFQILITAIAIDQELPVWITLTNAIAKRQGHGRRFNIKGFVVLNDSDSSERIEAGWVRFDWFQEKAQVQRVEKLPSLSEVR